LGARENRNTLRYQVYAAPKRNVKGPQMSHWMPASTIRALGGDIDASYNELRAEYHALRAENQRLIRERDTWRNIAHCGWRLDCEKQND